MARKTTPTPIDASDSEALHDAIQGIIDDRGRGGLSYVAERLGITASCLQKRLKVPGKAFDAPTLRGALLVIELRRSQAAGDQPPEPSADTQAPE